MSNIAIFASHNGTSLDTIYDAIQSNVLNLNIKLIITNNTNANVLDKATKYKIPNFVVNDKKYDEVDITLEKLLDQYKCQYIFLAGYMKKIPDNLTKKYKIINSHPALLPKYGGDGMYGRYVHEAVIKNGEKESGITVHNVTSNYDEGSIIHQRSLKLEDNETVESLEEKIKKLEQITIIEAFQKIEL
ncbi:MAG: phosphoribosylglycinamide formyltransferase [Campylobacterota bacterium]|nr:phosphoribosylglycinamide formyltransferase [Campylobacterota bacterium]